MVYNYIIKIRCAINGDRVTPGRLSPSLSNYVPGTRHAQGVFRILFRSCVVVSRKSLPADSCCTNSGQRGRQIRKRGPFPPLKAGGGSMETASASCSSVVTYLCC